MEMTGLWFSMIVTMGSLISASSISDGGVGGLICFINT